MLRRKPTTYEYQTLKVKFDAVQDVTNAFGVSGWRLVSITPDPRSIVDHYRLVIERAAR